MRQIGFLAAAGLYALDHHVGHLAEDHANARALAEVLAASPAFGVHLASIQTNIVIANMSEDAPDAATMVARAREVGVLILAFAARRIRMTTYLGLDARHASQRPTSWSGRLLVVDPH